MGKKKVAIEKKLALLARKASKAEKVAQKRISKQLRKERGEDDDDDDDDEHSSSDDASDDDEYNNQLLSNNSNVVDNMDLVLIEKYIKLQHDALQKQQSLESQKAVLLDTTGFPLPRANATLTAVTDNVSGGGGKKSKKNTISALLFGGEYFDGVQTIVLDQLFILEIKDGIVATWKQIVTPISPPPRCAHSAVYYNRNLYIFGGETTSNGSEEYRHYKDLWKYNIDDKIWTEISTTGKQVSGETTTTSNSKQKSKDKGRSGTKVPSISAGMVPTPRSGHGSVIWKHYMIIFGGFYEIAKMEPKFYNDLYIFDLKTELWLDVPHSKLSLRPEPRSRCLMVTNVENDSIIVQGGFSKIPKPTMLVPQIPTPQQTTVGKVNNNADEFPTSEANVHTDAWILNMKPLLDGKQPVWERLISSIARSQWKDSANSSPVGRCGVSAISIGKNRILTVGGVIDKELHHHQLDSIFYNDIFMLDVTKRKFFPFVVVVNQKQVQQSPTFKHKPDDDNSDDEEYDGGLDDNLFLTKDDNDDKDTRINGIRKEKGWDVEQLQSRMLRLFNTDSGTVKKQRDVAKDSDSDEEEEEKEEEKDDTDEAEAGQGKKERMLLNEPLPRIKASIFIHNNKLYVYGGLLEVGDREVTLDDLWFLDIKQKLWVCVYQGSMHQQVWKDIQNENDDESSTTTGTNTVSNKNSNVDAKTTAQKTVVAKQKVIDDNTESVQVSEEGIDTKKVYKKKKEPSESSLNDEGSEHKNKGGDEEDESASIKKKNRKSELRHVIRELVEQNGLDVTRCSPQPDESFEAFYSRTIEYWNEAAVALLKQRRQVPDEATIKEQSFSMATKRYNELQPIIERINSLMTELNSSKKDKNKDEKRERKEKKASKKSK